MSLANGKTRLRQMAFALFFVALGAMLSLLLLCTWLETYPYDGDPRNIYYVLWKCGLNESINLDSALVAMSHDAQAKSRVEGLTKDQLKARFGYLRTLGEVTPYYQACYLTPGSITPQNVSPADIAAKSEDVFFLRDSPWMVVMKNGRADGLVICKGY